MLPGQQNDGGDHELIISREDLQLLQATQSFVRYGFKTAQHHRATDFFLLRDDRVGFRFSIVMVDLAERLEVGRLSIEAAKRDYWPESEIGLPTELSGELRAERLVLPTEYGDIDSGMVLTSLAGGEIIIVPGAYPYTIEVKAAPALSSIGRFEPEYSIDRYERRPLVKR